MIVNLDKASGHGTHFVFLEIGNNYVLYWDPLGKSKYNNKNR